MNCSKTVVITGSSISIGQSIAELFASKGYNVLINFNKSEKCALDLCNKLKYKGLSTKVFKADV